MYVHPISLSLLFPLHCLIDCNFFDHNFQNTFPLWILNTWPTIETTFILQQMKHKTLPMHALTDFMTRSVRELLVLNVMSSSLQPKISSVWCTCSCVYHSNRILRAISYWVSFELISRRLRLFPTRSDWRLSDRWHRVMGLAIMTFPLLSSSTTSSSAPRRYSRFKRLAFSATSALPSWNPVEEHLPETKNYSKIEKV